MNSYVSTTVNAPSNVAIRCAYDAILSFERIKDSYLKENINTIYAKLLFKSNFKGEISCIITARESSNNSSIITITANVLDMNNSFEGITHEFVAEFLEEFSELLEQEG